MRRALRTVVRHAVRRLAPSLTRRRALRRGFEAVVPEGLTDLDPSSGETAWVGSVGIDLSENAQLDLVRRWANEHGDLFAHLRADRRINTLAFGHDWIINRWYQTPDAEIYAAMIAERKPDVIVEVGGGHSTLIARRTLAHIGLEARLIVVDPEPRTEVRDAADELILQPIESVDPARLRLEDRLLLFIDSSHVLRTGGDVAVLYNRFVPSLPAGSLVHAHDIYLPYDYPPRYQYRLYTEQYVLQALLSCAPRFEVVLASYFLTMKHNATMEATFGNVRESEGTARGSSFWFSVAR